MPKKGYKQTEEHKKKLSQSHKGSPATLGMTGKKHSEETKRKIGIGNKNKFVSEETRKKISEGNIGRVAWNKDKIMTDEYIKINSESHKGKCCGKNNHFYGKHHTEESKQKIVKNRRDYSGENNPSWKGGEKLRIKRMHEKRRELGYIFLNKPFKDSVGHHININNVLYIPIYLHKGFYHNVKTGKNMYEINFLSLIWLIISGEINNTNVVIDGKETANLNILEDIINKYKE